MGSSGAPRIFHRVLDALAGLPVTLLAARGRKTAEGATTAGNAFLADYLPGGQAVAESALMICNGGSPATHQALLAGVPVIGIAANMDQHLNMTFVARAGAGVYLRSEQASPGRIRDAVGKVLGQKSYRDAAVRQQHAFARYDCGQRLAEILEGTR
jgi:UDP:flavonoid glycosyltransferase YjiC (YdhE family)